MPSKKPHEENPPRPDINKERTRKATITNIRRGEERAADMLADRGWTVISPYDGSRRGPSPQVTEEE